MRKVLLPTLIIIAASLLVIRIFYLQVIDDSFKLKSENNAIKIKYDKIQSNTQLEDEYKRNKCKQIYSF